MVGGGAEGNKCSPVACGAVVLQVIKSTHIGKEHTTVLIDR